MDVRVRKEVRSNLEVFFFSQDTMSLQILFLLLIVARGINGLYQDLE